MTTQRTWSAAVVAVTLVFAAACGGGGDGNEATPTAPAPAEDSPTAASTQASAGASTSIDQSFWHAGWKVTLGEATVENGVVEIEAQFENLGEDTATFDSRLVLMGGGETYEYDELDQEFPEVPGGLKGNGILVFSVDDSFEFEDATLLVGNPANNQAVVPLGPNGDELVDLAPRMLPITGPATAGAVTLNVESAEVRADLPDQHSISEAGKTNIIVHFSATVGSGIPLGEGVLQSQNVALKLPDGTAVAVRSDGTSGVNELLQGKEGTTIQDLSVRFEVPAPAEGEYAFVVRGRYAPGTEQVEGELVFIIPPEGEGEATTTASTPEAAGTPSTAATTATTSP